MTIKHVVPHIYSFYFLVHVVGEYHHNIWWYVYHVEEVEEVGGGGTGGFYG